VENRRNLRSTIVHGFDPAANKEALGGGGDGAPADPAAAVKLPGVGDIVDDHYILVRVLGEGAFAKVYFAQRVDIPEHQVALKIFPSAVYEGRNVERELVMLATVGHPNVVQLKDHGTGPDYVWLTMPVYEGETLDERLKRGTLTMREAYDIFVPVARGIEALHTAGLRHQDIKPDNIYLAEFGGRVHPILLDLGVAAEREATFVAGTLLFASPEQIAFLAGTPGDAVLTEKMDTYGIATTLLMAVAGTEAFPGLTAETGEEIQEAHKIRAQKPLADSALPSLTGKPRELFNAALKRWLAIDPKARPTTKDLANELEVLLEPEREEARAEERRRMRQKAALQRVRLIALMLFFGAAAGGLYLYSKRETLAIAGELERARRAGAESFDKLDTCVASHALEKSAAVSCRGAREKDQLEFNEALNDVKKAGSATVAERAKQIERLQSIFAARLKAGEEAAAAALKKASDERAQAAASCQRDKEALTSERDEQKKLVESRMRDLEVCDTARHACFAEREAAKLSSAASPGPAAPLAAGAAAPPPGSPSSSPGAPDATGAPATPAPSPPPPAADAPLPSPPPAPASEPPPKPPRVNPTGI
jgi:hypothetical protein